MDIFLSMNIPGRHVLSSQKEKKVHTDWIYAASCYWTTRKSERLKDVGKSTHFVWWYRAILAPVVICDIKATLFLSTLATNSDLWQPAWQPALNIAVRHRLVSFGAHEPERQGGEADVKRFSPLMERLGAGGAYFIAPQVKSISPYSMIIKIFIFMCEISAVIRFHFICPLSYQISKM